MAITEIWRFNLFSGGDNWYPAIIGSGGGPVHARVPIHAHP